MKEVVVRGRGKSARDAYEFLLGKKTTSDFEYVGTVSSEEDLRHTVRASFAGGHMTPGVVYVIERAHQEKAGEKCFVFMGVVCNG